MDNLQILQIAYVGAIVYIVQTLFQKYPIDFINWQTIQNKQKSNWHSNK